jgi:uncharacterized protein YbcC (UPF0753/DUF2309 family)
MINELVSIIDELRKVIKQQGLNISDDTIFVQALTCYRTPNFLFNQELSQKKQQVDDKPTEKQLKFLERNGIKVNPNLTKREAKVMIETFINNQKEENI